MIIQDQDINTVIEPVRVSYWPLQPGWYLLIAIVLILLLLMVWKRYKRWLKDAYKREAIKSIQTLSNDNNFFFQLNQIIKAVAINSYGREKVASLAGKEWTTFLQKSEETVVFSSNILKSLESQQYQKRENQTENSVIDMYKLESIKWIKKHK